MTLFDELPPDLPPTPAPRVRVRMIVAYDGGGFRGFAPQPGAVRTIGGEISAAVARVLRLRATPPIVCAGRTDAGVHAWAQVVHVDLPAPDAEQDPIDLDGLHRRLVKLLAPAIVVRSVSLAPPGWDARRSALWRSYRYTVLNRPLPDPFLHGRVWLVEAPVDVRAMQLGTDPLIGEHDFSSFCRKVDAGAKELSLVRRVLDAQWIDLGEGVLRFDISATAFCQHMVRSVVGLLVDVGLGKRRAGEVAGIIRARDRGAAATVAPPEGLCLWQVGYPAE